MPFLGEIASISCALLWSLGVIFFRKTGVTAPAQDINLLKNTVAGGILLLICLAFPMQTLGNLKAMDWFILVLSAFIGISLADTLLLRSLQLIGAGRYAIIECLYSPAVIVLSFCFLNERLDPVKWIGISLVLAGVIAGSIQSKYKETDKSNLRRGIIIGILSPFFIAGSVVMVKPLLEYSSPLEVTTIRTLAGAVGNLLWMSMQGTIGAFPRRIRAHVQWKPLLIATFLGSVLAPLLWMAGFKFTHASVASVLNQTSVFFIIVFSALILKESITWNKLLGALLGFSGAVALILL